MLTLHQISKTYGIQTILDSISFTLKDRERVGLIGPNGCGKSTLLRIIVGEEKPDSGVVQFTPSTIPIGYLPQGLQFEHHETIGHFLTRMQGDIETLSIEIERLAIQLAENPDQPHIQNAFDHHLLRLNSASESLERAPNFLNALELGSFSLDTPIEHLSGGQKTRLSLAGVLLSNPQLLILDEPTNHLDFSMLDWLEDWLNNFTGSVLVVSHDRKFLDGIATSMLEIDPVTHKARVYPGNYSDYLEQKIVEREQNRMDFIDQQQEISRLQKSARHIRGIAKFKHGGKADTRDKFARGFFANRGLETIKRAKKLENRLNKLLNEDHIDKPRSLWQMNMDFGQVAPSGRMVLSIEGLSVGYGDHILIHSIDQQIRSEDRIALIGENGSGKSTFLETITGLISPISGKYTVGSKVHIGYMSQEQETLSNNATPLTTIQNLASISETEARAFLSMYLFTGDEVFIPVSSLSYGERARLMLASLVVSGCNFLILDEPINHLDISARIHFEEALSAFEGTVLMVVHDRYFINSFATQIWEVNDHQINVVHLLKELDTSSEGKTIKE